MPVVNEITSDRLRRLAEARDAYGKVLSLYVNLDPTQFSTRPARATELNAVLDEACRTVKDEERLTHDERVSLLASVEAVRGRLEGDLDQDGARALAVFAADGGERIEVLKLPRPVEHHVAIGDGPYLEPLARIGARERWWVLVVDRRRATLFEGGLDGLRETWAVDSDTKGAHSQGGWSQARYQRAVDKEAFDHLHAVAEELHGRLDGGKIDGLLVGGPSETTAAFERDLRNSLADMARGRFEVDTSDLSAESALEAARPLLEEHHAKEQEGLLEKLDQGVGMEGGRAAAGLQPVLDALQERKVDVLLVQDGFHAAGHRCPACGRLGVDLRGDCPVDGTQTEPLGDVVEAAIEATWTQDGHVRVLRHERLEQHGGIAALTRF